MLERTRKLKQKIQMLNNMDEKLDVLYEAFSGEPCYLITCGPSINKIWGKHVEQILTDNLTIAVKQAFDLAPHVMDFHLINPWNYKAYEYTEPKPIILMEREENAPSTPGLICDLMFTMPEEAGKPEKMLALNSNFEDYLFTTTLARPWGPGIVYELGIYLAVHLGVSELIMVGWDIGDVDSPVYRHHYDGNHTSLNNKSLETAGEVKLFYRSIRALYSWLKKENIDLKIVSELLPRGLKNRLIGNATISKTMCYYDTKTKKTIKMYNTPGLMKGEIQLVADSTKNLYYWLKKKGINLKIVSDRSLVDPCVPRIKLR